MNHGNYHWMIVQVNGRDKLCGTMADRSKTETRLGFPVAKAICWWENSVNPENTARTDCKSIVHNLFLHRINCCSTIRLYSCCWKVPTHNSSLCQVLCGNCTNMTCTSSFPAPFPTWAPKRCKMRCAPFRIITPQNYSGVSMWQARLVTIQLA